jgi:hypothetical protein
VDTAGAAHRQLVDAHARVAHVVQLAEGDDFVLEGALLILGVHVPAPAEAALQRRQPGLLARQRGLLDALLQPPLLVNFPPTQHGVLAGLRGLFIFVAVAARFHFHRQLAILGGGEAGDEGDEGFRGGAAVQHRVADGGAVAVAVRLGGEHEVVQVVIFRNARVPLPPHVAALAGVLVYPV